MQFFHIEHLNMKINLKSFHFLLVQGLLCGAIRNLRLNRIKPDTTTVLSILYLAKIRPTIFNADFVIESLCGLLKRDVGLDYTKSKSKS